MASKTDFLMYSGSRAEVTRKAAIASCDANRILLHFRKHAVIALYYHGLNAVTASKLTDAELLKLKGVGPKTVEAVRLAINTASRQLGSTKWPFPRTVQFEA